MFHYLPFCMVFTSSDKLHAKTAPLFMRSDQVFFRGKDLQADLKRLDAHFSAQPQEVLDRGVMHFEPPFDGDYLTTALWKRFLPGWRQREGRSGDIKMAPEEEAKLVAQFNQDIEGPEGPPVDIGDAMFVAMEQHYPVKMGKWRIIEEGVAQRSIEHQNRKKAEREATSGRGSKPPDALV